MTKNQLINAIAVELNLPKGQVADVVNCLFDTTIAVCEDGNSVSIDDFGVFKAVEVKGRKGTGFGKAWETKDRRLLKFYSDKKADEQLN